MTGIERNMNDISTCPDAADEELSRRVPSSSQDARLSRRSREVLTMLAPHARCHWRWFFLGGISALLVVAARLALPWPLRSVADQWLAGENASIGLFALVPNFLDPVLAMGMIFFVLIFMLGLSDLLERFCFARFSIATVRDLRSQAFASVRGGAQSEKRGTGDLVSRLVGDTARIKSGMQGFLVHVATNGLLFLGMTLILLTMDARLGLIFALAGTVTALVTGWAAVRIFKTSLMHRRTEGELANHMEEALQSESADATFMTINGSSGGHEAEQTRLTGIATWAIHGIFGASVLAALWVGSEAVDAGRIAAGDMMIFMMYALMMRGPIVRLARQGARTGKIFGAGHRIAQLSRTTHAR